MWTQSAAFQQALVAGSRKEILVCEVVPRLAAPSAPPLATIYPQSGSAGNVSDDETRDIRRTLSGVSLLDTDGTLTPSDIDGLLHPLEGNELRLKRGLRLPDGTTELNPLITAVISKPVVIDNGDALSISVQGNDRAVRVQRVAWVDPFQIVPHTPLVSSIRLLLDNRVSGLTYDFSAVADHPAASFDMPNSVFGTDSSKDPWSDARTLAVNAGCELFFDAEGTVVLRPIPDPLTAPLAATYAEGPESVVSVIQRDLDETTLYTGVVVSGSGTGNTAPVRAVVWDEEPSSPTYIGADGSNKIPFHHQSPLITTTEQAQVVAQGLLRKIRQVGEIVTATLLCNPGHEAGDVVAFSFERAKLKRTCALASFSIPLGLDQMSLITRSTSSLPAN